MPLRTLTVTLSPLSTSHMYVKFHNNYAPEGIFVDLDIGPPASRYENSG